MKCPDHQDKEMVSGEGKLVCSEAGCPRWAPLPVESAAPKAGEPSPASQAPAETQE